MTPYYHVITVSEGSPAYKNTKDAQERAEQVCHRTPGKPVLIVQVVGIVSVPDPKASTFWLDGMDTLDEAAGRMELHKAKTTIMEQEASIRSLQREIDRLKTL